MLDTPIVPPIPSTSSTPVPQATSTLPAPADASERSESGISNAQLNKKNHRDTWPRGNYRNYYTFRPASSAPDGAVNPASADALDGRLALLDPSLFSGKTLLDLGTNAGKIPLDALLHCGAKSSTGVDIDPLLIEDAQALANERGFEQDDHRCRFLAGDFMQEGWFPATFGTTRFDVVTLFSVTKWLHLWNGDDGMLQLFRSLHSFLPPGGVVVVEPQEWDNYKRAVKKNKDLRETFKAIKMRPPFEEEMRAVGFTLEERIEREEGGFSRPLLVWRKES
ncbi:hypothetical protein JCM11641_008361 [Rhodosporidiobolus odoratus]